MAKRSRPNGAVVVIFRKWRLENGGDVIALFPEIPATLDRRHCLSYEHNGQHGAADPDHVISITAPAKPDEYRKLASELESLDYKLIIRRKMSRAMIDARSAEINALTR